MMKSYQKFLKLFICFAAFFCAFIPTVNADIIFRGDTATGNIILRYEANKHWNDAPHRFFWGEIDGQHHDRHWHNGNRHRDDYRKYSDQRRNDWHRRDHDRSDDRKHNDHGPRAPRW